LPFSSESSLPKKKKERGKILKGGKRRKRKGETSSSILFAVGRVGSPREKGGKNAFYSLPRGKKESEKMGTTRGRRRKKESRQKTVSCRSLFGF